MNYHNKKFRLVTNTANGEVADTITFHYQQEGSILTCTYEDTLVQKGQLIGLVDELGNIDMRYHHINDRNELLTGICQSSPQLMENGKIRLHEKWQWTSGDRSNGSSILEEI